MPTAVGIDLFPTFFSEFLIINFLTEIV